jgi:membrane protease YdiL (CAAX protease family)
MVKDEGPIDPPQLRPTVLIHQEGVIGLVAAVGLALSDGGFRTLAPAPSGVVVATGVGLGAGLGIVALMWTVRRLPPVARLERWQAGVVEGWSPTDAAAVAVISGVAEEALLRAWLQPILGLVPAAAVFAALHVVPDRRLWLWPLFAFAAGLVLGILFDRFGYPAAAAAHVSINLAALLRLTGRGGE